MWLRETFQRIFTSSTASLSNREAHSLCIAAVKAFRFSRVRFRIDTCTRRPSSPERPRPRAHTRSPGTRESRRCSEPGDAKKIHQHLNHVFRQFLSGQWNNSGTGSGLTCFRPNPLPPSVCLRSLCCGHCADRYEAFSRIVDDGEVSTTDGEMCSDIIHDEVWPNIARHQRARSKHSANMKKVSREAWKVVDFKDEIQNLGDGEQQPEINNLNHSGRVKVSADMDSGAAESVAPPSVCRHFPLQESEGSKRGQEYPLSVEPIGQSRAATR